MPDLKYDKDGNLRCKVCGCTEFQPCDPPCSWSELEEGLCSLCEDTADAMVEWAMGANRSAVLRCSFPKCWRGSRLLPGSLGRLGECRVTFRDVDDFLLDRLSSLAGRVQMLTGWDCLAQSDIARQAGFSTFIFDDVIGRRWLDIPVDGFLLAYSSIAGRVEDATTRSTSINGLRNIRRLSPIYTAFRYAGMGMAPHLIADIPSGIPIGLLLLTLAIWLDCCDPLPPCGGKIREWARGLKASLRASEVVPEAARSATSEIDRVISHLVFPGHVSSGESTTYAR